MRKTLAGLAALAVLALLGATRVGAEDDLVTIHLRDGSRLVGRVVAEDESGVRLGTVAGEVSVPRSEIVSMVRAGEPGAAVRGEDPNYSRLMFAPTGRPLRKGDGYFADYELLFPGVAYGLTDNFSLSAGISTVPAVGLSEQLFYISPKVGWNFGDNTSVAVGALFARAGGDDEYDDSLSLGIGYVVGTFGSRQRSVSLGFALGDANDSDSVPIVMVGGHVTVSRRVALVTESWLVLNDGFSLSEQPFGLAVRFFGERLSADVGVILIREVLEEGFPIPWLSMSYHFGKPWAKTEAAASKPLGYRPSLRRK